MSYVSHDSERYRVPRFVLTARAGRINPKSLHSLALWCMHDIEATVLAVTKAVEPEKILGIAFNRIDPDDPEKDVNFTVVSKDHEGMGLGSSLLRWKISLYGKRNYSCTVALDNLPSLKMVTSAGLVGTAITTSPNGKPAIRFTNRPQ